MCVYFLVVSCIKSTQREVQILTVGKPGFRIHSLCKLSFSCFLAVNCVVLKLGSVHDTHLHFFQSEWVCMCEWQPGISLLSATYVSVNRPAELQGGVKFCPIPDLWPKGAFFLTKCNLIFLLPLWYIHLPRPARCPTKNEACMTSSTCTDLHQCIKASRVIHFSSEVLNPGKVPLHIKT